MSRAWGFYVNQVASSPLVTRENRQRIYRANGLEVDSKLISPRCFFHTADIYVGREVRLNHGVHIENVARVEIGANAGLGVNTVVLTSDHDMGPPEARIGEWHHKPVTIGEGCWVGARCLILAGVTLGPGCVVAAGSVVRHDCAPNTVYAGVPARPIRELHEDEASLTA